MSKVGIVVQARAAADRLPGKVLLPWGRMTILEHIIQTLTEVPADEHILAVPFKDEALLRRYAGTWHLVAGDEQNVLSRFLRAARAYELDFILRICADSPLINADMCTYLINSLDEEYDFMRLDVPDGFCGGLVSVDALSVVATTHPTSEEREHVTLGVYSRSDFKTITIEPKWSIDTVEEYRDLWGKCRP